MSGVRPLRQEAESWDEICNPLLANGFASHCCAANFGTANPNSERKTTIERPIEAIVVQCVTPL
jgi:hypothetical protein